VPAADPFSELLRRTHLSAPSSACAIIIEQASCLGARAATLYIIDYEQNSLVPLGDAGGSAIAVTGTLAGRAFSTTSIIRSNTPNGEGERLWVPLLDGTERLGVLDLTFRAGSIDDQLAALCERYAHLAAILLVAKSAYGDAIELARRRDTMTIASELAWSLAPPLVCATDGMALAGMLEPCYDNGGDALDYALNDRRLHVAMFDAMGHGLAAAGVAAFAVAAYRHSRRRGCGLADTYAAMDRAVADQFPDERFVTALIAELDIDTGRLQWVSAGHPLPLVLRRGRQALSLAIAPATPLGVESSGAPTVGETSLEPGDLLLFYTDGLSEVTRDDGSRLGVEGLSAFIEREAAAGLTVPETLRRLRHSLLDVGTRGLDDDATAILVEWRRGGELDLLPATV
jgi:hypothetical protein